MANKMLIDASHPEETRVVVVRGSRIEEFDFESEHKKQLKGNIYLAKVTRVEPSLQAAFIEYGGNRHGFLAFSEIHPDYYQIPIADRQALLEEELARADEDEEGEERKASKPRSRSRRPSRPAEAAIAAPGESVSEVTEAGSADLDADEGAPDEEAADAVSDVGEPSAEQPQDVPNADQPQPFDGAPSQEPASVGDEESPIPEEMIDGGSDDPEYPAAEDEADHVEEVGAEDAMEEVPVRQRAPRRQYKIQEVIKRRQILLVQVVKEERGNKGAALTTYLSLAGRYSVLMPNTARGGGISRKITNAADRKRLKEVARDLEVPRGMGIILRTAGANRTKAEVKRDYEYLMRLWETVRTLTLASTAPTLVYEEGSLIKRSIRDLYNKDIDQVLVSGDNGYREAKDFMRMLMPSQAKVVQPYREPVPIFARQGIEAQLDKMLQPNVTLKSGGYIIINQTEALVAIDVNSGRSTREHSVEDTAYQTNMEAAEEVARQLRLRDLAGLIVIDFIDMEEKRNNRNVEKKLKDCLKDDRARIQLGRISHFGLMEMSRQRIRASVLESTTQTCPTCGGIGHIRSDSSLALHVLRAIEEHVQKHGTHDLIVKVPTVTALYVLNEKRATLDDLEENYGLRILIQAEDGRGQQHISIEHGAEAVRRPRPEPVQPLSVVAADVLDVEEPVEEEPAVEEAAAAQDEAQDEQRDDTRRRRRRRRRRGGSEDEASATEGSDVELVATGETDEDEEESAPEEVARSSDGDEENGRDRRRRRRGRRGGRRNRDEAENDVPVMDVAGGAGSGESVFGEGADAIAAAAIDADEEAEELGDHERRADPSGDIDLVGMLEPAAEAEMVGAIDALDAPDPEEVAQFGTGSMSGAVVPDENEIIAAAAEASSAIDGIVPLDEVFPDVEDATSDDNEIVESEIEAADDQPDRATSGPRITANGTQTDDTEADRPKRTGWWARRSFF